MSSTDNNEESDLYIFKGMEGFEEFNPSDDSTLIALLDDLQEDTLMTLFSDDLLMGVSEDPFKEGSYSAGQSLQSESPFNIDNDVLYRDIKYCQESNSLEDFSDQRKLKRSKQLRQEGEIGPLKRPRLNSISEKYILDHEHTLTCVRHDHSYALPPEDDQSSHLNSPNSDEEVSNEESNNSDAGKALNIQCYISLCMAFFEFQVMTPCLLQHHLEGATQVIGNWYRPLKGPLLLHIALPILQPAFHWKPPLIQLPS